MDTALETPAANTPAPEAAPSAAVETGLTASEQILASKLNPDQAEQFVKAAKAKKAGKKEEVKAGTGDKEKPAEAAPVSESPKAAEGETITFGEPAVTESADAAAESADDLTEEDLAKLDEKTRKRITDVSKENAKVRKRAQEAEGKLTDFETRMAEREKEITDLREGVTRAAALAGNIFSGMTKAQDVGAWGNNAVTALSRIDALADLIKEGKMDSDATVSFEWPNGEKVELSAESRQVYQRRVDDARAWFQRDDEMARNREAAKPIAAKHEKIKGYGEARERYLKDASLGTRLEEMAAKAALYDVLENRKAVIHFPDTAGAAKKAPSPPAGDSIKPADRKTPPSETPASLPRMAPTGDDASDLKNRKSALMERARTAETPEERQRLLKEAIMLGNPDRSTRTRDRARK